MNKKILIVDDDPNNIFALSLTLKARNFLFESCSTGKEAIEILKNNNDFSLILMDMMMPDMDGYEALAVIRSTAGLKDLPVIAVTAQAMEEDRQKCLAAGASDYVSKPINVDILLSTIEKYN